jgi:predicted dehydrogenase
MKNMSEFPELSNQPVVVFGAGSIGERHLRNLWSLGFRSLYVFRQRNMPFRDLGEAKVNIVQSWKQIDQISPYAAIICTPTSLHLEQTLQCVQRGIHVLVEKPLSHNLEGIETLKSLLRQYSVHLQVGYMMRYHPFIQIIKKWIEQESFGPLLYFQSKWAEYLPDWHPWEDYRTSYAARKELGGGVALTLSHDLDIANFLAGGLPSKYAVLQNRKSSLQVNVEAGADFLLAYPDGVTGHVHLNYFEKCRERFLRLVFENASVRFEYFENKLILKQPDLPEKIECLESFDRNDLFISQSRHFFEQARQAQLQTSLEQINSAEAVIEICQNELPSYQHTR